MRQRPQAPAIEFPARIRDPEPVSRAPWTEPPFGASGNDGQRFGLQGRLKWAQGDIEEKVLLDVIRADSLWRVSVFGPVVLKVNYGTSSRGELVALRAPLVLTIPGQSTIIAAPFDPEHGGIFCRCTLTPATAWARAEARKVISGPATFDLDAVRYVALDDSVLNISSIAVTVPALSSVPLVAGSVLTSGSGFQEFEA